MRSLHQILVRAILATFVPLTAQWAPAAHGAEFRLAPPPQADGTWLGPEFWANRLQDWRVRDGWFECVGSDPDPMRTAHILTYGLGDANAAFSLSVRIAPADEGTSPAANSWAGMLLGAGEGAMDYRAAALIQNRLGTGSGVAVGIRGDGTAFIGDPGPGAGVRRQEPAGVLPREGWRVVRTDSAEKGQEGERVLDGDPATIWHTEWQANRPTHPHEIVLDLGAETPMGGILYLPRQEEVPGRIDRYEVYVSATADAFGPPAATGRFPNSDRAQRVRFPEPARGRYLRLVALDAHLGRPSTTVAELYALAADAEAETGREGPPAGAPFDGERILRVTGVPDGDDCRLVVRVENAAGETLANAEGRVPGARLTGNLALVSHPGSGNPRTRYRFSDVTGSGPDIAPRPSAEFGPILCTQYTLSRGVLKLTAQFPPPGAGDAKAADLVLDNPDGTTTTVSAPIVAPGYTATFRVEGYAAATDVPYRVVYNLAGGPAGPRVCTRSGTIRKDPTDKRVLVVAGFTGNHNNSHRINAARPDWPNVVWFPHADVVDHVRAINPDVLFFSGDQVYEGNSPTRADIRNIELDYLYKWYLWCWAYRDLTRDTVAVTIPDDHDVYQGNLWGGGGGKTDLDTKGGYVRHIEFVKMSERTQTSHLPDPRSTVPLPEGMTSYFTDMVYGRIGFAILEDRKFKSGPYGRFPGVKMSRPDHVTDMDFDVRLLDLPGLRLLGEEQLAFVEDFVGDWRGTDMKVALSQTIFANMATHHGGNLQRLRCDMDSNGWPQSGRNRAIRALRKGFVFHLAGDQHLASLVHHGVEAHGDSIWSMCVPSVANFYPRGWSPEEEGANRPPDSPAYLGDHKDGFGNPVTVYAVTNPVPLGGKPSGHEPAGLHDGMPGYGILRLDKQERTITVECRPRYADPRDPATDTQYPGWPKTIRQTDNYAREAAAVLPAITVQGVTNPVIRVFREDSGELVYALRLQENRVEPRVFDADASYRVEVGDPDGVMKTLPGLRPGLPAVTVTFP